MGFLHGHGAGFCGRLAVQKKFRPARGEGENFHVVHAHALRKAGAERLDRGFLGGEASGHVGRARGERGGHAFTFLFRENAADKAFAVALQQRSDARQRRKIESSALYHEKSFRGPRGCGRGENRRLRPAA